MEIKLEDVYKQVRELMTEYGIGDNTLFVTAAIKGFYHRKEGPVDKELQVSLFVDSNKPDDICKTVTSTSVESLLIMVRGLLMEWSGKKIQGQQIEVTVEI